MQRFPSACSDPNINQIVDYMRDYVNAFNAQMKAGKMTNSLAASPTSMTRAVGGRPAVEVTVSQVDLYDDLMSDNVTISKAKTNPNSAHTRPHSCHVVKPSQSVITVFKRGNNHRGEKNDKAYEMMAFPKPPEHDIDLERGSSELNAVRA